ncbi:MAG: hypothetical protein AB1505_08970 [Candidatus Latescibacterota bacterium]
MSPSPTATLTARLHPSGFGLSDSNFYSCHAASDGRVYYTLCCHHIDAHARVYQYDPAGDRTSLVGDLGVVVGEAGQRTIPQGKSHVPFYELDGGLFLATHYGYFQSVGGKESPAGVPEGYRQYPGGHFLRCDLATGQFHDYGTSPEAEGVLSLGLDGPRRRLYGLTWPTGLLIRVDLDAGRVRNLGPVCRRGEAGSGPGYLCLCRAFAVVPDTGRVYFTLATGDIRRYDPDTDRVSTLAHESLRRDILGAWKPHTPGHQGYNWRDILWHPGYGVFYGIHPKSAYLFLFDPQTERLRLLDRICAQELRASGQYEPFRYGYLTLRLGPDGRTLYYLTGGPPHHVEEGSVGETTHLVTYDLPSGRYADHGFLRLEDGRFPTMSQSLAIGRDGRLYACPWIEPPARPGEGRGRPQVDLVSFRNPLVEEG